MEKHLKSSPTGSTAQEIPEACENPDAGWHPMGLGGETAPEVTAKAPGCPAGLQGWTPGEDRGSPPPGRSSELSPSGHKVILRAKQQQTPRAPASRGVGRERTFHSQGGVPWLRRMTHQPPWRRHSSKTGSRSQGVHQHGGELSRGWGSHTQETPCSCTLAKSQPTRSDKSPRQASNPCLPSKVAAPQIFPPEA